MAVLKTSSKKTKVSEGPPAYQVKHPHDYNARESLLDPLFRGEADYLIRMIRMREIYAIELMLEKVGLTLSAWYPLAVLRVEDGMSQRELGARLSLKDAAIGKALDALERSGLIVRTRDKIDRRKSLISLTDEGKKVSAFVAKSRKEFQSMFFSGFSDSEKDVFKDYLERSFDNIESFIGSFQR